MKKYYINDKGLAEIKEFLAKNHRPFRQFTASLWAQDAVESKQRGESPTITIRAEHSYSGEDVSYTISDAGIDSTEVNIDG